MKKLLALSLLTLSLFTSIARAEEAERLKITGFAYGCDLGGGLHLLFEDKMGRRIQGPAMDYDWNAEQITATNREDGSFPIANLSKEARENYQAACDNGWKQLPQGERPQIAPDLKVFLIRETATQDNPGFKDCRGNMITSMMTGLPLGVVDAFNCHYVQGQPTQYEKLTFAFVRKGQRVDRTGAGLSTILLK